MSTTPSVICTECQSVNRDGARFCASCGKSLAVRHAFVLAGCAKTKQPYVIRFEYQDHGSWKGWVAVAAHPISREVAERGGHGPFKAKGDVYGGAPCPFCGAASFFEVHEKFSCWDGARSAQCAWCTDKHWVSGMMRSINCAKKDI
jgi:hypothetical protein